MVILFATVAVILACLFGFAATKPDRFRIERTKSIHASPESILALIGDFRSWASWSPYEKLDPSMKKTYSGAASGKGSVYQWSGNAKAGEGRMEITDVTPSRIMLKLDFIRPFKANNFAEFSIERAVGSANVTWALYGPEPYLAKVMTMFFNRDKLVGTDFETGLANLKAVLENTKQRSAVCS